MIALIGLGPSKRIPDCETWGLAWDPEALRYDRVFEMHDWGRHVVPKSKPGYLARLREFEAPVYMQTERPEVPASVRYPLEAVTEIGGDYFSGSVAYMLALAILENPARIALYGFDMTDGHGHQRPNTEYWIGVARGRGIDVIYPLSYLPHESEPQFDQRYGFYA